MPIHEIRHPLIRHKLGLMRRADISTKNFRELAQEVGALLTYEATAEDPMVLTKPWIVHTNLMLREGTRLQEYVCAENNLAPAFYERIEKNGVNFRRP